MRDKPSLQDLLEVQRQFELPSQVLVEKDWYVVTALAAINTADVKQHIFDRSDHRVARGERNPDRRRGIGARQETEERNPATVPMDAIKLGMCYDLLSGERNGCRGLQPTDEPSSEPHAKSVSDLAHWPSPIVGEVCSEIAHPCQSYPMPVRQTSL